MSDQFIEKIFAKKLTDSHKKIIRKALQDEYHYEADENITHIVKSMEQCIGESVSRNIITQLVGEKRYYESSKNYSPHEDKWKVIVQYLMYSDEYKDARLTPEHFQNSSLSHLAPSSLAEFFGASPKTVMQDFHYTGEYSGEIHNKNKQETIELKIEPSSDKVYYKVTEIIEETFSKNDTNQIEDDKDNYPIRVFRGWAVVANDDKLLVLLRDAKKLRAFSYVNIAKPLRYNESKRIKEIYLVHNRNLIEDYQNSDALEKIKDNVVQLTRKGEISCKQTDEYAMSKDGDKGRDTAKKKVSRLGREGRYQAAVPLEQSPIEIKQNKVVEREAMETQEELGRQLWEAANNWDWEKMDELRQQGAPINYQDPATKMTVMHSLAYDGHKEIVDKVLAAEWDEPVNLLLRDKDNLLPSGCAGLGNGRGNVMVFAGQLTKLEKAQGLACDPPIKPRMYADEIIHDSDYDNDDLGGGPG